MIGTSINLYFGECNCVIACNKRMVSCELFVDVLFRQIFFSCYLYVSSTKSSCDFLDCTVSRFWRLLFCNCLKQAGGVFVIGHLKTLNPRSQVLELIVCVGFHYFTVSFSTSGWRIREQCAASV